MPTKTTKPQELVSKFRLTKVTGHDRERFLKKAKTMGVAPSTFIDGVEHFDGADVDRVVAKLREEAQAAKAKRAEEEAVRLPQLAAVVTFEARIGAPRRIVLRPEGRPSYTLFFEPHVPTLVVGRFELEHLVRHGGAAMRFLWIDCDDIKKRIARESG